MLTQKIMIVYFLFIFASLTCINMQIFTPFRAHNAIFVNFLQCKCHLAFKFFYENCKVTPSKTPLYS